MQSANSVRFPDESLWVDDSLVRPKVRMRGSEGMIANDGIIER